MAIFEPVLLALARRQVRYVIVGGVAVVLQGYARLTADLDLVVDLEPAQALSAVEALLALGLRPRAPVDARGFAAPAVRRSWIEDKGMRVFSFWDPTDPLREVDLFVEHPIPFEDLFARADELSLGGTTVRVASIDDLIALKRLADRAEDRLDIEALEVIREEKRRDRGS
ncbi:MAG: hypothetical protein OZ921_19875 [Sorangiineae bacterium]|nr:hypothetical protein [Polyangiaceae bacterium]MEB2324784.1 hypothetical protein [Sorangiineae bacterium]